MKNLIILMSLTFSSLIMAGVDFYKVGSDNSCDFTSIQAAIDAGLSNEVRISTNGSPYLEHLIIDDIDMILRGGYADCSAAQINITDLSYPVIDGSNTGNVIAIKGSNTVNTVELRHLFIGNGDFGIAMNFGATSDLVLDDVLNFNNNEVGIQAYLGTANIKIKDSDIISNGNGGIDCIGSNLNLIISGDSKIENNAKSIYGAGLNVRDGCEAIVMSPTEISNNTADVKGGAIYVSSGSTLIMYGVEICSNGTCYGDDNAPVMIKNNSASSGGGIFATGENTVVAMFNVVMDNNSAIFSGGALKIEDFAKLQTSQITIGNNPDNGCWNNNSKKCNQFINNKAASGGVIEVTGNAEAQILNSWIKNNRADSGVIARVFSNGELVINNSSIVENGNNGSGDYLDKELFILFGNINFQQSAVSLEYVTIADNSITEEIIENSEASLTLHSSIVAETKPINNSLSPTIEQFECLIVNENSSFSAGATVMVADPEFINAANDDYHIQPTSPAVDYCYEINNINGLDSDFEQHGFDDPNKANLHGTFDIGADEYIVDNDIIFTNSFEMN